jgi:1-acyl-sn-glycerol-3-phosphate acyltransferase
VARAFRAEPRLSRPASIVGPNAIADSTSLPRPRATPLRVLRLLVRIAFAALASGALATLWFAVLPFCSRASERRRALRAFVLRNWARACLAGAGVVLEVEGAPPSERCFLVSNHLSYLDVLVLASQMNCVFVSMAEVLRWPFIGPMAKSVGTVFIDRRRKREIPEVNREMESFLEQGFVVVLFPEGTSSRGARVERFRPALLEPAVASRRPVATATLRYATTPRDVPAPMSVCWVQLAFVPHALRLLLTDRIDCKLTFDPALTRGTNRKQLAAALHTRTSSHFTPMQS